MAGCGGGAASTAPRAGTSSSSGSPTASAGARSRSGKYTPTRQDFRDVAQTLADRARAIRARDLSAFMATVDRSNHTLVSRQRTLFSNMAALPLASLHYAMDKTDALVPAKVAGHDPVLRPEITEFLRLAGSLDRPVTNAIDETFVERGRRWVLGAEAADGSSGQEVQWRPWGGPPISTMRSGDMTLLIDRSRSSELPSLARAIHDDIAFDAAHLGVPASYQVVVDATSTGGATTFSSLSKEEAAAVTFGLVEGTLDMPALGHLAGLAIKVNPHNAVQVTQSTPVLRHELTHYLLRPYSKTSPIWLSEGIATWVQYYPDSFAGLRVPPDLYDRLLHADRTLPSIGLFNISPDVNYIVSQAAVTWLVSHYGMPKLLELMRAYRAGYRDANVDALTPRMLHQVYGVSEKQVVDGAFGLIASFQH